MRTEHERDGRRDGARAAARLLAAAGALAVLLAGCGGGSGAAPPTGPSTAPTVAGTGAAPIALSQAVGQRIVTGYHGSRPPRSVLRAVRRGQVGGVILFGENVPTASAARAAARALQAAAAAGRQPYVLVMIDQEGGEVRRLAGAPPDHSPAVIGASAHPAATASAAGRATGRALRGVGVNVDLAPVADVPAADGSFLGTRAFGRRPETVAHAACGFADGLARAGVAATLKHFPGLGRADGNTDLGPVAIAASARALTADLAAYRRCADRVPLVMVSSASYPALGIDRPAVVDRQTYRLLADTGFRGLTVSDALDTPAIAGHDRPARAAVRAGVDLLLYGADEDGAHAAYAGLLHDARAGSLSRSALEKAARRILAFKQQLRAAGAG